jgi:hypothetical protein
MAKAKKNAAIPSAGLEAYIGQPILLMCQNYFYHGLLLGVFADFVLLQDPSIVYETGEWTKTGYTHAEKLHTQFWRVMRSSIESYGAGK